MPTTEQTLSIGPSGGSTIYSSEFSPVIGGFYRAGVTSSVASSGYWWGSEKYNSVRRYGLIYTASSNILKINEIDGRRSDAIYIRCVSSS